MLSECGAKWHWGLVPAPVVLGIAYGGGPGPLGAVDVVLVNIVLVFIYSGVSLAISNIASGSLAFHQR